jgi:elongation factor 2
MQEYMGGAQINISDPVVSYRETVTARSDHTCMAKSPNKHNRMYMEARPLEEGLPEAIDEGDIGAQDDVKVRGKVLVDKFGWDKELTKKIWCFGPDTMGPNMLLDATKAVQYLSEIKDSCVGAFQWASKEGALAEENMRGCAFEIMDVVLHADAIHRGAGAIMPCTRRSLYASMLCGQPRILEPIFLVEITCPQQAVSGIYSVISLKRGTVVEEVPRVGTPLVNVKAHLPVSESFGFTGELRASTSGQAFPTMIFDHWEAMPDDPLKPGTRTNELVKSIRKRKGLKEDVPLINEYEDKL